MYMMKKMFTFFTMSATIFLLGTILTGCSDKEEPATQKPKENTTTSDPIEPITQAEIEAEQTAWGEGLVSISTAYANDEDYGSIAQGVLDDLYGYKDGTVLFKPTLASDEPFRFTEEGAASYFIGGTIEEDTGFALKTWTDVRFADDGQFILNGDTALWMGSVFLTGENGEETRVEKTMGYYKDEDGDVRLQLHHSSIPFEA